jgi:hypothetical protein
LADGTYHHNSSCSKPSVNVKRRTAPEANGST